MASAHRVRKIVSAWNCAIAQNPFADLDVPIDVRVVQERHAADKEAKTAAAMISGQEKRSPRMAQGQSRLRRGTLSILSLEQAFAQQPYRAAIVGQPEPAARGNIAQRILAQDEAHVDVARKVVLTTCGMLQLDASAAAAAA